MKYKLYTTSLKAWDAMFEAIDQARKTIYIEMYIFLDDTEQSHDFFGKLKEKARDGIHIIIVADAYGSKTIKKETLGALRECGVEFIFFSNWLRHIHRKILIVDEEIAFIGGVNIGKQFKSWHDLQLRLHGRIVKKIMKSFAYTYEMAGGKNKKILDYRESKFTAKLKSLPLEHWPIKNIYTLKGHYIEKISQAQKSIHIVTPYFTPPRWLISLLDDAVRRNVLVEIIVPARGDIPFIDRVNYRYMYNLHRLGVKFFLSKEMNHSKLLLIDDSEGLIGSQNIDMLSFHLNAEMGIFFQDKKLIAEISRVLEEWKLGAVEFTPKHYKMRLIDYLISALMKLLRPIL